MELHTFVEALEDGVKRIPVKDIETGEKKALLIGVTYYKDSIVRVEDEIYHGNLRYIKVENVKTGSQDYLPVFLDEEKGQYVVQVFCSKYERITTFIMSTWVHSFGYRTHLCYSTKDD